MSFLAVLAAGLSSYIFGAIWYMSLSRPWMTAAGIEAQEDGKPPNGGPVPYIVAFLGAVLVAGMMRHIFSVSGILEMGIGAGLTAGLGLGLFLVAPWIATNYAFAGRNLTLTLIDAGYAIIGCSIMGVVLTLL
ncbi:hypothetical protein PH7735_03415 [Shimia thalassica]|uniref:DUF1761 domain-containing protein n=1 Tax=Shimia thalassica TaxID=1715693 RepID=A0A0P1IFA8_9RHOB|nr:DUF1761 domain-containing protein [Shimia thalassica]CUK09790.1 hypothetical protein PH7735_03415 [Shimia thalassica]